MAARGGRRCAATTEGLFVDDGAGFRPRRLGGPSSNDVTALAVDGAGKRLAIGTFEDGLTIRDGRALARPAGIEANETVNAATWQGDTLWVGTYAKGVTRLALGGAEPVATHLGGGYVNAGGIVLRGGTVHVATMEHLLTRPTDDDAAAWTSLRGAATGRDVTQIAHVGGETWVASRRGIAIHRGRPW